MELLTFAELWRIFESERLAFVDTLIPGICRLDWVMTDEIVSKMLNTQVGYKSVTERMATLNLQQNMMKHHH